LHKSEFLRIPHPYQNARYGCENAENRTCSECFMTYEKFGLSVQRP